MKSMRRWLITAACAVMLAAGTLSAAAAAYPTHVMNSDFEDPQLNTATSQVNVSRIPYWNTTAYGGLIEIMGKNTNTYIPGTLLEARSGKQAAELNADEQSTLYQYVSTTPGSFFEWGISHHGRRGPDTMLLVIGPKQVYDPKKPSKSGVDQFMQIGEFIRSHEELSSLVPSDSGCSEEIVVYTSRFADNGAFESSTTPITLKRTRTNTEEWHIWFIRSDNDKWYDYGTASTEENPGYNYLYEVPADQEETVFAFVAYENTIPPEAKGDKSLTYGNLIDNLTFGLMFNLTVEPLAGGNASAKEATESEPSLVVNSGEIGTKRYRDSAVVTITAEANAAADYGFAGALINGTPYSSHDFTPVAGTSKSTLDLTISQTSIAKLIYSRNGHVTYEPNGGVYNGTTAATERTYSYYTNGLSESEIPTGSDFTFTGWEVFTIADGSLGVMIPAEHRITYSAENTEAPILTVEYTDENGEAQTLNLLATKENGVTFVAQYNYLQLAASMTKVEDDSDYEFSKVGGKVTIRNDSRVATVSGSSVVRKTSGAVGDSIEAVATAEDGYVFDGWFESEDAATPLTKATTYAYSVIGVNELYAKFSPAPMPEPEPEPEPEEPEPTPVPTIATCVRYDVATGKFTPGTMDYEGLRPHGYEALNNKSHIDKEILRGFGSIWYTVLKEGSFKAGTGEIPESLKTAAKTVAECTNARLGELTPAQQAAYGRIDSQAWKASYSTKLLVTPFISSYLEANGVKRNDYIWLALADFKGNVKTVYIMDRSIVDIDNLFADENTETAPQN